MLPDTSKWPGFWLCSLAALALGCVGSRDRPSALTAQAELAAVATPISPLARISSAPIDATNVSRVKLRWETLAGGFARAVAVSSRLGRVVFSTDKSTAVYQLATGAVSGTLQACDQVVRGGMFFHETSLIVVCRQGVERHDVVQRRELAALDVHGASITAAALAGGKLALAHRDGVVRVHDLASGELIEVIVPGPPIDVKSLALDVAGERVAVAWVQGSIWWWELKQPEVFHKLVRNENESDSIAFAPNGSFAEEGRPTFTTLWRFDVEQEPRKVAELRNGDWVKRLLFTRDSLWLVRGGSDGLDLAEASGPKRVVLDSAGRVEDVAMDETGSVIVVGDRLGRLLAFAVAT